MAEGRVRIVIWTAGAIASLFILGVTAVVLLAPASSRRPPLPNPNGYETLLRAANMVAPGPPPNEGRALEGASLEAIVKSNAAALVLARTALTQECRVKLPSNIDDHLNEVNALKRLAFALEQEAKLASLAGRHSEAADTALDIVRLSQASCRGGLVIDSMVGSAIERMGVNALQGSVRTLDAADCARIAAALEALEVTRESIKTVLAEEKRWGREVYGIQGQLVGLLNSSTIKKSRAGWETKLRQSQTQSRQVMVQLAARAFLLNTGRKPLKADELVPAYLKAVPTDPASNTPISLLLDYD